MWIVRLALRRPYTFVVLAILILLLGAVSILRTPTDVFPNINIPVASIIWSYNGFTAQQMSDRIVSITERNLTTVVDNIERTGEVNERDQSAEAFCEPGAARFPKTRRVCSRRWHW